MEPGTLIITKTSYKAIDTIAQNADNVAPDIGLSPADVRKWLKSIFAINCLCDPVKRLFSDFLHVKAVHKIKKNNPRRTLVFTYRYRIVQKLYTVPLEFFV